MWVVGGECGLTYQFAVVLLPFLPEARAVAFDVHDIAVISDLRIYIRYVGE